MKKLSLKTHTFWPVGHLTENEHKGLRKIIRNSVYFEYLFWLFSLLSMVLLFSPAHEHPKAILNPNWSVYAKILYRIAFSLFVICGYYVGNLHQTYYAYGILRNYYQMNVLIYFLRSEMRKYEKLTFATKVDSERYQAEVKRIVLKTIERYQSLRG